MNQSYNLRLTEKEIKAIQDYTGFMHARMNAIADLNYRKLNQLEKTGWNMNLSTEDLENTILKFVDVYAAIYKAGSRDASGRLYRGTNQSQIDEIQNIRHVNSILSTSLEEDIVKTFTPYGNDAVILRLRTEENLPHLYVEGYKEAGKRDEAEVLILPFAKVKKMEHSSNWNGYTYYNATLEREELEEVPKQELETLKAQLMEGYDYYREQATECLELEYLSEELDEKSSRYKELRGSLYQYEKEFSKMLKGMCKEKELEIDKQQEEEKKEIEVQQKAKQEEEINQLKAEIKALEDGIDIGEQQIVETIEKYVRKIEENASKYQRIAEDLKIGYSMNPHFKNLENIQAIKRKLQENKKEEEQKKQEEQENTIVRK